MIIPLLQTYLITLLIVFAIGVVSVYYNKPAPLYVKFLPWFMLLIFIEEKFAYYRAGKYGNNHDVSNIFLIIEFLFYSFTLYQMLRDSAIKKWIIYSVCLYVLTAIPLIFFIQGINYFNSIVYFIGGLMLSFFSGYYMFALFRAPGSANPFYAPGFWIACSILFYHSCTMPLILPWPLLLHCTPFELKILHIALTLMYCIAYVLFAIGFCFHLRMRKPQVSVVKHKS